MGSSRTAWAQDTRKQYSELYDRQEDIPSPPPEIYGEDGMRYILVGADIEDIPVTGRKKDAAGEIVYKEVGRNQIVPETAVMEITDDVSGQAFEAELALEQTEYLNERWKGGLSFVATFHDYGAEAYWLGNVRIPHDASVPQLELCRQELLKKIGMDESDCRLEQSEWAGEAYTDEEGTVCRDALVTGMQRVFDCRAVYAGTVLLPDYTRYRLTADYEQEGAEEPEEETRSALIRPASPAEADTDDGSGPSAGEAPIWLQWLRRGVTVSISLFLIILAVLGFRWLRKKASRLGNRE